MGREIRRVPPNWEHPQDKHGHHIPLHDTDIETAGREWLDNCIAWENGTHQDFVERPELKIKYPFYWMWSGDPPDPKYRRPKFEVEPTWFQVYETVSEGTPVTPAFATKEELIDYLVEHGDFWDAERGNGGWSRENAVQFVEREWAPSFVMFVSQQETKIMAARDGA